MYGLARWLLWSVLLTLAPFGALMAFKFQEAGTWPGLEYVFGSGQLLLPAVAISAGGIKELTSASLPDSHSSRKTRDLTIGMAVIFIIFCALLYGANANAIANGLVRSQHQQQDTAILSLVLFLIACVLAASASHSPPSRASKDAA